MAKDSGGPTPLMKRNLAKDMVSEIVLSDSPEKTIRKWRDIFKISQKKLANEMGVTSSVVSDYESGRRKSPGINVIKRFVNTLLEIDSKRGGKVIRTFGRLSQSRPESGAIIDIRELSRGIMVPEFCEYINVDLVVGGRGKGVKIYGYTVIDSLKAITEFSFSELVELYGTTSQRAMIFTKVSTGKTPMVALKLTNLKPALTVLHGLDSVDEIAKRIAEAEGIPLGVCRIEKVEGIVTKLKDVEKKT